MNLDEIKKKFRHRTALDIKDLNVALEAAPMLVRELDELEKELAQVKGQLAHLEGLFKKKPPTSYSGRKGKAEWEASFKEKENALYLRLTGVYDYKSAKSASNQVIRILPNLRPNFDLVLDVYHYKATPDPKVLFHLRKIKYHFEKSGINRTIIVMDNQSICPLPLFEGSKSIKVDSIDAAMGILKGAGSFLKA
ncbi:hypothetical protein QUF70_14065 [Desulfobacterales bacterium HSG17]|nr:hypothetical protein [Desulfobacterales bacterium HSG17]